MKFFKKYKSELLLGSGAVLAGIISFFITIAVYPEIKGNRTTNNQVENQIVDINQIVNENEDQIAWLDEPSIINSQITEEVKEKENDISIGDAENLIVENFSESTSNDNIQIEEVINQEEINELVEFDDLPEDMQKSLIEFEETIQAISQNTISYEYPISGEIILDFAQDKLVYSETLEEWITHDGIDIKGEVASPVKAADDGIIESVKMDPRYGKTIIINHNDVYKTVYSNLSTLELVHVGKKVKKGDIISGIGEGFGFESKEGPHIHFEIIRNGECKNPVNG